MSGELETEEDLGGRERELEILNEDAKEWKDTRRRYERINGDIDREIGLGIGFDNWVED